MNIHRIRRTSKYDRPEPCDFCDEPADRGYRFYGVAVEGGRGSNTMVVCDACLARTRQSDTGAWRSAPPTPEES